VRDATTMRQHMDHKVLLRERELKITMGHREDDHEEDLVLRQSM
jgi:hypothetical protein